MNQVLLKEIIWGLSMMAVIFGFGFQMDESMFSDSSSADPEPISN